MYLLYSNKWVNIFYEEDSDVGAVAATTGRCVVQRRTILFSFLPPLSARYLQSCLRYNSLSQHYKTCPRGMSSPNNCHLFLLNSKTTSTLRSPLRRGKE